MDKKYLDALSNFAYALDELVEEMKKQSDSKASSGGSRGGDFGKINNTLESISNGIEEIKDNTKEILSNQKTLLKMGKDGEKSGGLMSGLTKDKDKGKMKEGVGTILLMSGAIMAIGLAFKVVSGVDFMSVIALSLALPLISFAFVEIARGIKEMELSLGDILFTSLTLIVISGAVTLSSWIMSSITPISLFQFLTALGVSLTLAIASIGISFMLDNLSSVSYSDILKLPETLVAISMGIMLSSYILSGTNMIDPSLLLNVVLQGIAMGIVTAAMVIPMAILAMSGLKMNDILLGSLFIVAIAGAITLSSHILAMGDFSKVVPLEWAKETVAGILLFSIPVVAMGLLSMTGVGLVAVGLGSLMVLIVAGSMSLTSHILSTGNYEKYPNMDWIKGVVLSIGGYSLLLTGLGSMGIFAGPLMLMGGYISGLIVSSIVATSKKFKEGDYSYSSDIGEWGEATSNILYRFTNVLSYLGRTGLDKTIGDMMVSISQSIVDTSNILSGGDWKQGPTEEWAEGVSIAIGGFAPVFSYLQKSGIISLFGGDAMTGEEYSETIRMVGQSIVDVAGLFSNDIEWGGHPTKDWAEGVGLAIGSFAPVFGVLQNGGLMGAIFGNTSSDDLSEAIITISGAIKQAAKIFSKDDTVYTGGPDEKWSKGVGLAISSFSKVYEWVFDGHNWTSEHIDQANKVIFRMARSILHVNKIFGGYVWKDGKFELGPKPEWTRFPDTKWTDGVGKAYTSFGKIYDWVYAGSNWTVGYVKKANGVIFELGRSMLEVADILAPLGSVTPIDPNIAKGLSENLDSWTGVVEKANDMDVSNLFKVTNRLTLMSQGFNDLAESLTNLSGAINGFNPEFISVLAEVSGVDIEVKNKEDQEKTDGEQASWWDRLLGNIPDANSEADRLASVGNINTTSGSDVDSMSLKDLHDKLEEMNQKLQVIASSSTNMSEYVNELRSGSNQGVNIGM